MTNNKDSLFSSTDRSWYKKATLRMETPVAVQEPDSLLEPTEASAKPPSRRAGYEQPSRDGLVAVTFFVPPTLRSELKALAREAGYKTQEMLVWLVQNAVESSKKDPQLLKSLRAETDRYREQKRRATIKLMKAAL